MEAPVTVPKAAKLQSWNNASAEYSNENSNI